MERNYPSSSFSFSDPLAPSAQSAAWAYERAGLKPSLSYGAGHAEAELLHRQAFTAAQLPAYSAAHHPAGLAGLFDTSLHGAGINTTETSVMNFLSAIESRTAASSGATLLPQFRASSWQTGMHSSADLFVTGALPTSGTFPPTSALSAYQHPSSFSSRNFVTTPSLSLQDGTFNASSNGILTHDPLLQLKTSPCAIPTALTFDRLSSSVLASSLPIQSSTYRSAQESAPHLLQPQFSLLPSALAGAQQASQAYSTAVFAGSPASIERALQRECSVIKHHQRPSSSQSVQAQLAGSHHSLQTYLSSAGGINFHDTRQSTLSCSPLADITQVSNGGLPKTSRVTVELAQSYTSAIPSSGYPLSSVKGKNCSTKPPPISTKTSKPQNVVLPVQTQSYNKSSQSQSSVIASQAQIYSTAQLPNLLAVSQSQSYVSTQSPNRSTVSDSQAFSALKSEKLPLLYKSINTFSSQSQAITSDSQTLSYSAGQQHSLPLVSSESYSDQARNISSVTPSQSYTSNQPQGLSPVSQSPINYTSQSHGLSVSPSVSYSSRQHLTSPAPSLPFSSSSGAQNMSVSSPTPNYISMASSQNSHTRDSTSPQSQTFSPAVQSPFASPTRSQALQNNRLGTDVKSYGSKRKLQSSVYSPLKQDTDFPMQDLQALQQQNSLESSTQSLAGGGMREPESAYRVSKSDDRYHSPSVIRSSSRLDDQGVLPLHRSKTDGLVNTVAQLSKQIGHIDSIARHDLKHSANLMQTSHEQVRAEELNQQNRLRNKVHETKTEEHPSRGTSSSSQIQTPTLSHTQPALDSACDLHLLQQSFLHSNYGQTKTTTQVLESQNPPQITHPFLQLDSHIIPNNGGQQHLHLQHSETLKGSITCPPKPLQPQQLTTKDNFRQPDQHDFKNQFVSLGSICFPESMLLTDERNILSNVDDILAATAAACGVPTQEFAKVSSDEGTQSVENVHDSEANFQLGVGHVSPSFTPSQAPVPHHENTSAALPSSSQIRQNFSSLDTVQSNLASDNGAVEMSDQNVRSGMSSPTFSPVPEEQDHITAPSGQSTIDQNIQEDSDSGDRAYNNIVGNQNLSSSDNSLGEETAVSDNDIGMCVDNENVTSNEANMSTPVNSEKQTCANSLIVSEGESKDITQGNLNADEEMENNSKSPISEDENATQKWQNDGLQAKRLISKGIDLSLPCSPADIAESYFDSSQHQERIRQKIKEVEEQQPEVKCGFIGSFLDFLKGDPKNPTSKALNRTKRPGAPILRAPFLQHVPFKNLPLMTPLGPQDSVVAKTEKEVDDGLKKNLETLPSFSSSDEDSGGGPDLQKSISTALSALDHAAEKMKNSGQAKTSAPALQIQHSERMTKSLHQKDDHIIHSNGGQSPQPLHPQNCKIMKMDITGPSNPLHPQQLTTKDTFKHPERYDLKKHFIPLGSVSFSGSMLVTDEWNMHPNVNDSLSATASEVTTQEFSKAVSNKRDLSVENRNDTKSCFQSDVINASPSINLQATVAKHENVHAVSLNSSHKSLNLSPIATVQSKNVTFGKTNFGTSVQNIPSEIGSPAVRPGLEVNTCTSGTDNQQFDINYKIEKGSSVQYDVSNTRNQSFSFNSVRKDTVVSHDFSLCTDNYNVIGKQNKLLTPLNTETHPCDNSVNPSNGEKINATAELEVSDPVAHCSNKLLSEDGNADQRLIKNGLPVRCQISKGIDLSLLYSPDDIAESYFDSFEHQEKIRQKIKEVQEQQPEVKSGFIGSFLDFLKEEPKQQFIPPPTVSDQTRRTAAPVLRAPYLQHVPFKNLPLMTPVAPLDVTSTETLKKVENGFKKDVKTLPSFSSHGEDSGGDHSVKKSISTALSALDASSEKRKKSESAKLTAPPAVKKEPVNVTSPVIKTEEKPNTIEPPKLPDPDSFLPRKQDTVAFLGLTDGELSDSGGEGIFRERDEFVVKLDDIEALQLALCNGEEPPAIWRVQKALLQKFVPEVRYGIRQYSATNSYLGYFGDAKTKYKRVYAKFIENANKKEYVRLCSRKPKLKAAQPARTGHTKVTGGKASESTAPKVIATKVSSVKSKSKQPKVKAEPPPKKRKTWKGEFSSPSSETLPEGQSEENGSANDFISSSRTSTRHGTVQSIPIAMDVDPPPVPKEPSSILKESTVASKPPPPALIKPPPAVIQSSPALIQAPHISKQPPTTPKQPPPALKRAPPKRSKPKRAPAKRAPPKQAPLRPLTEMQPEQSSETPLPQTPLTEKPQSPNPDEQILQAPPAEETLPHATPPNEPVSQLLQHDQQQPQSPQAEEQPPQSPPAEKQSELHLAEKLPPQTPPADKQPPLTPKKTPTTPKQSVITPDTPPVPFASRSLRTRAMKETFRSYMELLVSVALDADTMQALEKSNDELLLPHMRKIEGMINEGCSKVLDKLSLTQSHKSALENFPELTVITRENKSKKGGPPISKIKVNGKAYNKKTLRNTKSNKSSQEFTVDPARTQLCSLYHSLHHYRYHVYLICKDEIATIVKANADLGQEQIVQLCMKNMTWVETLFERFGELLSEVQEKCG